MDLHFNDISLQKLMLTSHTKLNLPTNPCQKDPDYNFQALRFIFMSTLVIAANDANDTNLSQACVRESLAKRLIFMIMKIRMIEKSMVMIFTKGRVQTVIFHNEEQDDNKDDDFHQGQDANILLCDYEDQDDNNDSDFYQGQDAKDYTL